MDDAEMDALLDKHPPVAAAANSNAVGNRDVSAAQAAQAWQIAAETGASPELIYHNISDFSDTVDAAKTRTAIEASPPLASWLAKNPFAAKVGKDELPKLADFAGLLTDDDQIRGTLPAQLPLADSFARGLRHHEYQTEITAWRLGQSDDKPLKAYEAELALQPPASFAEKFGEFLGATAGTLLNTVPPTLAGAGVGAAAGAVGLGVGTAPGAVAGALAGARYGFLADIALTSSNEAYRHMYLTPDKFGNRLPEATMQTSAIAVGLASAAIANIAPAKMLGPLKNLFIEAVVGAVTQPSVAAMVGRAGVELSKAGLTGAIVNVAFNLASELPQQLAKATSGQPFETIFESPEKQAEFVKNVGEWALDGAALFAVLAVPGVGARPYVDALRIQQAHDAGTRFEQIFMAAQELAMRKSAPELLGELVREANKGDIALPIAALDAVRQQHPDAFGYVRGLEEQVAAARDAGGDVIIPASEYFTKTDPAVHALVKDEIRSRDDALNVREATELEAEPVEYKPTEITLDAEGKVVSETVGVPTFREKIQGVQAEQQQTLRDTLFLNPLFVSGEAAGMSEAMFARYSRLIGEVQERLNQNTFNVAERAERRQQGAEWKARMAPVRAEAEADFNNRRDVRADRGLRGELRGIKFDPKVIDELMNDASYSDSFLGKRLLSAKDAIHPDEVAEVYEYSSGIAMLHDLRLLMEDRQRRGETPARQARRLIDAETQRRMEAQYGKLEDNIQAKALDAVLHSTQMDLLHEEVKALAGKAGLAEGPLTIEEMRMAARERFSEMPVGNALRPQMWERLVGQKGLAAERALLKSDFPAAFLAKQEQLNASLTLKEARQFRDDFKGYERLVRSYQDKKVRGSRDPEFVAQIHGMLRDLGFVLARHPGELANALASKPSLVEFWQSRTNAHGDILADPSILSPKPGHAWNVQNWRDFGNVLKTFDTAAKRAKEIQVGLENISLEAARREIAENLATHTERFDPNDRSLSARARHFPRLVDSWQLKIDRLFQWIDQRDPLGPLSRLVIRPLFDGQHKKGDMVTEVSGMLKTAGENLKLSKMNEKIDNTLLIDPYNKRPMHLTRESAIAMALNWGTKSNRMKLLKGMGWGEKTAFALIDKTLTKPEWDYVQAVWKIFEHYWPERDAVVRKMSGVGMDPVEGDTFSTKHGYVKGGYYPIIWDTRRGGIREEMNPNLLFNSNPQVNMLPARGSTIARVDEIAHPILLELKSVLSNRINEMLHQIAFHEPLVNAHKILLQGDFKRQLEQRWGPEYADQLKPWLENIASGNVIHDRGLRELDGWLRNSRAAMQSVMIGYNLGTAQVHSTIALMNSVFEALRTAGITAAPEMVNRIFTQFGTAKTFAFEHSGEIRNRMASWDRDINTLVENNMGSWNLQQKAYYYAHLHIAYTDLMSAVPTWLVAYDHYVKQGYEEGPGGEASFAADMIVRNAHSSSGLVSQSAILRQNQPEVLKWFTMFMGAFNHNYNQIRDIAKTGTEWYGPAAIRTGSSAFFHIVAGSMAYLVMPGLWHAYIRPEPGQEQDSWGEHTAKAVALQLASSLPIVRDVAHGLRSGRLATGGPAGYFVQTIMDSIGDAKKLAAQGESPKNWLRHSVVTFGALGGVFGPIAATGAVGRAAQFLWDLHDGRQFADDFDGYWAGLTRGQSHPKH